MNVHKLARYNGYKKTESGWFREVPIHWISGRIKDFVDVNAISKIPLNLTNDDLVEFVPMTNVNNELGKIKHFNFVPLIEVSGGYTKFRNKDVIFAKITPCMENGNCAIVCGLTNNIGFGSTEFMVFRALRKLSERYLHYFLHNELFRKNAEPFMRGTAGQKRISSHYMSTHYFALPTMPEQRAIADYLDNKTAQIDCKIDLLSQKATKYCELKQSLINETITRGLDKTIDVKDSGVDWFGHMPKHWEVKRLKDIANQSKEKNGINPVGAMLSVSGYRGIEIKQYEDELKMRTDEELSDYRVVRAGQLVVNTMWLKYRGIGVSKYQGYVSPAYRAYYLSKTVYGMYIHYLMRSDLYVGGYTKYLQGIRPNSLQMKNIDFECFPVILPDYEEQKAIADYLDTKTAHIDRIVETITIQIDKLKELRKTIINDVVTGKIKVTMKGVAV